MPHLVVIGDVMVDHYVRGHVDRISPEAPVPVVRVDEEWLSPGGAANVAENLLALGAEVTLVGRVGDDEDAQFLRDRFRDRARIHLATFPKYRTERKSRYLAGAQQLIRIDHATVNEPLDQMSRQSLLNHVMAVLAAPHDGVVCSDYIKGCFDKKLAAAVRLDQRRCFLDCKPQGLEIWNAGYGSPNPLTFKPNRREYEELGGEFDQHGLLVSPFSFAIDMGADELLVTLGADGLHLAYNDLDHQQRFSSGSQEVFSVVGAGDTALATYAWARSSGANAVTSALAANLAATDSVRHVGTVAIEKDRIMDMLLAHTEFDEAELRPNS